MRFADSVTTRLLPIGLAGGPLSEVVVDGVATGNRVPGAMLESALAIDDDYLLFMTDGEIFEDMLSIHLIDRHGQLLDTAWIGGWYSSGTFSHLSVGNDCVTNFRFVGDADWSVEVYPEPRLRLPFLPEAIGVTRPFGFQRRFRVRSVPRL